MLKLNIGSGETKLEGFVNLDTEAKTNPDVVFDIRKKRLPYDTETVDTVYALHIIEHIESFYWEVFFNEVTRVLKIGGELVLAYPEWEICAKYYLENYKGLREFWQATLYGRQLYPGDYHVTPVHTNDILEILKMRGFVNMKFCPESNLADYHTFLRAYKGDRVESKISATEKFVFGTGFDSGKSSKFTKK